jgi:anaerobic selenocysteine-containing dehydrogenase
MLVNPLLLRGNIGKPGAGIASIRGHSNVQDPRAVGITEKTKLTPLEKMAALYGFDPPHKDGRTPVDAGDGIIKGTVKAFVSLGGNFLRGNFLRAVPERGLMEEAWKKLRLSVQIATKLNRSHVVPGERIEIDEPATGPQAVSVEGGRDAIERTYPDEAKDFDRRMFQPDILMLITLRGDGQFNVPIYNENDRFRGVFGSRDVAMMNAEDMIALGLKNHDLVTLITESWDGYDRRLSGLQVVPYSIPRGCIAGYYPECNILIPLWHYAEESKLPAAKAIPVRVVKEAVA